MLLNFLAAALIAGSSASSALARSCPEAACRALKQTFPDNTLLPSDEGFINETQISWSTQAWLLPACVFAPSDASQLSFAVQTLANTSTPFAMRGGGHMPISDAASIESPGVLISSTNLNTLHLSEDRQTMSIGPGPRWGDVYQYMDGTNLIVVGGRLAPVGVPGLLLGGGISYYSYLQGLASTGGKIKAYEAVLANGTIATVTADNAFSDLHWALQGGGNSFALITRFDLHTFPADTPLMAGASYGTGKTTRDAWLAAALAFTVDDVDPAAAIIPVASWAAGFTAPVYDAPVYDAPVYDATLFYNGSVAPTEGPFVKFFDETDLKSVNGSATLELRTLVQDAQQLTPAFGPGGPGYGFRQKFRVVSGKATAEAMDIVHDTYFDSLRASGIADRVPGFFSRLAFQAITETFARASAGSVHGVPVEPAFWVEETTSWSNAEDDAIVEEFVASVNAEIESKLQAVDALGTYLYLNDADKGQDVFAGYGEENLNRLREIRDKYDPGRIFTDLMPGGFKVAQ